jgi:thiamine pyrophosphate-dependent acetolactate synthase large subunit-like protein
VQNTPGPVYFSCAHETLAVDLAIGYTAYTGRPQAVMLHTGVGLLQGAMGIDAAQRQGIPMVIVSGEALTYGDRKGFDPGPQWQAALSVVGGPQRLVEPIVKWATQASSPATLFQQVVNAGEMAQRSPAGPTYLTVPIETMLAEWSPPANFRMAPPPSRPVASAAEIERVAKLLADAKNPVIVAESSGREPAGYHALVELAELLAIPVVEAAWADYANFPKDNPLHQGFGRPAFIDEADLILTLRSRAPWYPPSNRPAKATVVALDETPFRPSMAYHNIPADMFLEGDVPATLKLIAQAVGAGRKADVAARRERWSAAHHALHEGYRAAEAKAAGGKPMAPLTLVQALGANLPRDAIYVDETITHRGLLLRHLPDGGPQSYFRVQGGLGQGLGVALGDKMAVMKRPVVSVIGDGSFMYNPIVQSLALARQEKLPILIVIFNNRGYDAMKLEHKAFYPDGVAAANNIYYGREITGLDYEGLIAPFGGFGRKVDDPAALPAALKEGMAAVNDGRTAIINVVVA